MLSLHSNTSKGFLLLACLFVCAKETEGFQPAGRTPVISGKAQTLSSHLPTTRGGNAIFLSSDPEDEGSAYLRRFTEPVLDDPSLPLTDVLMAQIVAPALQVFWIGVVKNPSPSWLQPIFNSDMLYQGRGSLLAPTLIHGAGLASCWLLGALASQAYERKAFDPTLEGGGYGTVFLTIIKAGAFATGALIFATQMDLLFEYGRWVQLGESTEIDLRLLTAIVELLNDIFFEALVLTSFRLYLAVSKT